MLGTQTWPLPLSLIVQMVRCTVLPSCQYLDTTMKVPMWGEKYTTMGPAGWRVKASRGSDVVVI